MQKMEQSDAVIRKFFNEDMPSATKYINKVKQQIAREQSLSSRNNTISSQASQVPMISLSKLPKPNF